MDSQEARAVPQARYCDALKQREMHLDQGARPQTWGTQAAGQGTWPRRGGEQ